MFSGFLVATILLLELIFSFSNFDIIYQKSNSDIYQLSNTHEIGKVLYTEYFLPFQIAGCILFSSNARSNNFNFTKKRGCS